MFKVLINSFKVKEIRNKILYTLLILFIVRLGAHIALPGIDLVSIKAVQNLYSSSTLYSIIAGGANSYWSIFALGIGPYITSSIIMQLLTVAVPKLEQLNKEGEGGRKKIQSYTRGLTIVLAALQGIGTVLTYKAYFAEGTNMFTYIMAVITLVAGTAFVMWLAELITEKGVGNGTSFIIFVNIVSSMPMAVTTLSSYSSGSALGWVKVAIICVILVLVMAFVVRVQGGERRIPVQYSSKIMGRKSFGGQSSNIPIKVSTAGVISVIFAVSLLQFPQTINNFTGGTSTGLAKATELLNMTEPLGAVIYILLIFAFSFFYTSIVINPNEMAETMKKNGGFIPGIRPGSPTSKYIDRVVNRITLAGAICFAVIAIIPLVLQWVFGLNVGFGGTTLVIVAGVALDINKTLESQLLMRHYKGFLN